ncbi:MAG: hypothetical protein AAGC53_03015 [Actinomycetota bacterium]
MQPLPRRSFLGLAAGSILFAACGGGTDDPVAFLQPTFPDGFRQEAVIVAGIPQRLAFVVSDEIDILRETAPPTLDLAISSGGATVMETTVERRVDGIITPYYPATVTLDTPGTYTVTLPGRDQVAAIDFLVVDRGSVLIPQVGDQLPVVNTPTFDDNAGVADICTRAVDCQFHEIDLVDAAANDKPTVLLIATPGFCQTDICGPVVDLLIEEASDRSDLNVIHAEVYVDPSDFAAGGFPDLTDVVQAAALPFEPSLFVADANHTIVARLDTTFDRSELRQALDLV